MLEKLIANLKESLPEPLRKKLGMEENTNEEEQPEQHSDEESKDSHDPSANENDKKKKQISMIIRVVVILGLAYLAVDQFVLKNDDAEVATVHVRPRRPRKKPVVAPVATEVAGQSAEIKTEVNPEVKPETPQAEKVPEASPLASTEEVSKEVSKETPPVENINIADKKLEEAAPEAPPKVASESAGSDTHIAESEQAAPAVGEVKTGETQVDKSLDSLIESVDSSAEKTNNATSPKKETRLEDKIVEDDVYTPAPQYDQLGRGLVYNCKEKYWACVDKISYITCNKNMKWNKAHGKPVECAVQSVYNSDDDCGVVQKYNISTSKPTSFCQ